MVMKKTIKITIGLNDAFKGTLRCSLTMKDGSTHDFPSKLTSVNIKPLSDIKNKPNPASSTVLEPLPKKDQTELDLATLNILLTAMNSIVILSDASDHQYLYEPSTSCTATLAPYSATAPAPSHVPKSRLAKAMSDSSTSSSSKLSLNELIESTKPNNKKLVKNSLAWFHCLEKGDDDPLIILDLTAALKTCTATNEPTPQYIVTQIIPNIILGWTHVVDVLKMKQVISKLWMTPAAVQARIRNTERDDEQVLRHIQLQALLRLQLLAMDKDAFMKVYSKQLVDKKRRSKCSDLISEVTTILEGACFLLGVNKTLPQFLSETIPVSLYCSISEDIQEVFDFFECENPFVDQEEEGDDDDDAGSEHSCTMLALQSTSNDYDGDCSLAAPSIRSPKKKQKKERESRRQVKFEDGNGQGQQATKPVNSFLQGMQHADLTMKSVHLTGSRRRSNPLIKDSKASYVGSHFNTKLANISAHYHEVPVFKPKARAAGKKPIAGALKGSRQPSALKSPRKAGRNRPKATSPTMRNTNKHNKFVVLETPKDKGSSSSGAVGESPFAGRGRLSPFDMISVKKEELFGYAADDRKVVIGESPVKKAVSNKENRGAIPFNIDNILSGQPTKARKSFSLTNNSSKAVARTQKQQQPVALEQRSSSNARRMAQEALAATRMAKQLALSFDTGSSSSEW